MTAGAQPGQPHRGTPGGILETIDNALAAWDTSPDAMRWQPDPPGEDGPGPQPSPAAGRTTGPVSVYSRDLDPELLARVTIPVPPDLAAHMRHWLAGAYPYPPAGLRFDCSCEALGRVSRLPHIVSGFAGLSAVAPAATGRLGGIPVVLDRSLPPGGWKLASTTAGPRIAGFAAGNPVVREGDIAGGHPTALERAYWLADLQFRFTVAPEIADSAREWVTRRAQSYAFACGHEIDPALTRVTRAASCLPWDLPWDPWLYEVCVSAPREPARYPVCGDWFCPDAADWADADPVAQPTVFAGAVTEKRCVDSLRRLYGPAPSDVVRAALAARRRQAAGEPLWTIDVRPRGC